MNEPVEVLATAPLPNTRSHRAGHPVVRVLRTAEGTIEFDIVGLDPTTFEAVVGPEAAREFREFSDARRRMPAALRRRHNPGWRARCHLARRYMP